MHACMLPPYLCMHAWSSSPSMGSSTGMHVGVGMSILYQAHQDDTLPRGYMHACTLPACMYACMQSTCMHAKLKENACMHACIFSKSLAMVVGSHACMHGWPAGARHCRHDPLPQEQGMDGWSVPPCMHHACRPHAYMHMHACSMYA